MGELTTDTVMPTFSQAGDDQAAVDLLKASSSEVSDYAVQQFIEGNEQPSCTTSEALGLSSLEA